MTGRSRSAADRVLYLRLKERIIFPDLSERRSLKLAAVPHYAARAHFGAWHRRMGQPDVERPHDIFTPLFFVDVLTTDLPLNVLLPLHVRGHTFLAKTLDAAGAIDHIVREGDYLITTGGAGTPEVARARMLNVFTRDDPDPARRRVTALPPEMGLGTVPRRITEQPTLDDLLPLRPPDWTDGEPRVWHYGQTDPNRHVNGMEYLRTTECYVADVLRRLGHDLRRVYFSRARMLYRKPCFRGEAYRQAAWFRSEAPLVITGAFYKGDDAGTARPAVAVELTVSQHDGEQPTNFVR